MKIPRLRIATIAGACLFVVILAVYLASPYHLDQSVCLASAQQTDFYGPFPENVVESWSLRGLGHKLSFYALYKAATLVTDYNDKLQFEFACHVIASAIFLSVLAISVFLARNVLRRYAIPCTEAFFVGSACFLLLSWHCACQAEDLACWMLILGVACSLTEHRSLQVAGGALLAGTIIFKGVTAAVGASGLACVLLLELCNRPKLWTVGISYVVGMAAIIAAGAIWAPTEISDLINATLLQDSVKLGIVERIKGFAVLVLFWWWHLPLILGGLAAGVVCFVYLLRKREFVPLTIFCSAWLLAAAVPFLQGKGFVYHYISLLPISAGSILAVAALGRTTHRCERWVSAIWIVPAILGLVTRFTDLIPPGNLCGRFYVETANLFTLREYKACDEAQYADARKLFDLDKQPEILYLNAGTHAYYFKAKSCLRHLYPLPLQRDNPSLQTSPLYKTTLEKALAYRGEYITLNNPWFPLDREDLRPLMEKLSREYRLVYEGVPPLPKYPWEEPLQIFQRRTVPLDVLETARKEIPSRGETLK